MCILKLLHTLLKSRLKIYFMHYYIETFLSRDNFFDTLLVFVSFLQTYCNICSHNILSVHFFLLQISFCIYLLLALLISLYHFHNNLLLYLVLCLGFFDTKLNQHSRSFLYIIKIFYKTPFLSTKLEPCIMLVASPLLIYQK